MINFQELKITREKPLTKEVWNGVMEELNGLNHHIIPGRTKDTQKFSLVIHPVGGEAGLDTHTPVAPLEIRQDPSEDRGLRISMPGKTSEIALHLASKEGKDYGYLALGGETKLRGNNENSTFQGSVSIGTKTTSGKLMVYSTSKSNGDNNTRFQSPNLGNYASHIHYGKTGDWYIRSANKAGKVVIQDQGGNVGIGVYTPKAKLHVNGNISATEIETSLINGKGAITLQNSGGGVVIGAPRKKANLHVYGRASKSNGGTAWEFISSDIRVKKDIKSFTDGLEIIRNLRPVFFKYNGKGETPDNEQTLLGFIAQEVQGVYPPMVTKNKVKLDENDKEETELLNVNLDPLKYLMLNAISELDKKVQELNRTINELKQV